MGYQRTDSFTAGAGPLDSTWTQQRTTETVNYDGSGAAVRGTTSVDLFAFDNTNTYTDDQYAKCTLGGLDAGNGYLFAVTRANGTGDSNFNNYFVLTDGTSGASHTELGESVAGVVSILRNYVATFGPGDVIELRSIGPDHEAFKNSVSLGTHSDATHVSGSAGVGLMDNLANSSITEWEGGSLEVEPEIRSRKLSTQQRMTA